ncbi:MAG: hypothetical protein ACSLEN_00310 [Candidatus Malihini olakiniferum]
MLKKRGILTMFMEDALLADIDAVDPSCSHSEFFFSPIKNKANKAYPIE